MCCIPCFGRICTCLICIVCLAIALGLLLGLGPFTKYRVIHFTEHNFVDFNCDPYAPGSLCRPGRPFLAPAPSPSPSWLENIAPSPFQDYKHASIPCIIFLYSSSMNQIELFGLNKFCKAGNLFSGMGYIYCTARCWLKFNKTQLYVVQNYKYYGA